MQRRPSPLLQDYKFKPGLRRAESRPVRWFAAGLGIPLLASATFLMLGGDPAKSNSAQLEVTAQSNAYMPQKATETAVIEEAVFATTEPVLRLDSEVALQNIESELLPELISSPSFHPPLRFPEPGYESIAITIASGDTLDRLFRKHELDLGDLAEMTSIPEAKEHLRMLRPGDEIAIQHDEGKLVSLYRNIKLTSALEISRQENGFGAKIVDRPVEVRHEVAYGRITTSLFESGAEAGLSDKMIMNLAGIFAWDVDFVLDIRNDDNYYIVYEELWQDGELAADGAIVAAEFNNKGRSYQAVRYVDKNGRADYFTPDGHSVRKAFVRAPVDFTRISSSFNPQRRHPILNTIRAHRGVDYAAPRGTAIMAAGDGKVIFRGVKGGYGNAVILQHGGNITTLYAHMNAFDRKAGNGTRVVQGQTIGYVGDSGLATAPHLHYEYRLNGVHRNPRTVELPQANPIKSEYMQDFLAQAAPVLEELQNYKKTRVASLSAD